MYEKREYGCVQNELFSNFYVAYAPLVLPIVTNSINNCCGQNFSVLPRGKGSPVW